MAITRRLFLRAGALIGIASAAPLTASAAFGQKVGKAAEAGPGDSTDSIFINTGILSYIEPSVFEEQIGAIFLMRTDALHGQELKLEEVKVKTHLSRKADKRSPQMDTFTLLFSSPEGAQFPQASYLFEHEQIGLFPLFVAPVMTPKGLRYEAVINRLRGAGAN
jgi:uncharacterized protein DUF6916